MRHRRWEFFTIFATLIHPHSPQLLTAFPEDRSLCPSDNVPCLAGDYTMAAEFPMRVTTYTPPPQGYHGVLNPLIEADFVLPEGLEIDFTGQLELPFAEYTAPVNYNNTGGDIAFVGLKVRILVNDTHFTPENVSILPGTTVTWVLETFETVIVRSLDEGAAFNSGPINRNWSPTYNVTFNDEGEYAYRNAEIEGWKDTFKGNIKVDAYNCSAYILCTVCLAYDRCLWCSGNGTCIERDPVRNLPVDTDIVVKIPHVEGRDYQSIKYMYGYNIRTAQMELDWFPWPPFRNNPRAVKAEEIPSYTDPTSSTQCVSYMRTRDASQCEDYTDPPLKNRVNGVESDARPTLTDFFSCYEHVRTHWAKSDFAAPILWEAWPERHSSFSSSTSAVELRNDTWEAFCCELCSSCNVAILAACNITCNATTMSVQNRTFAQTTCPFNSTRVAVISRKCSSQRLDQSCLETTHNSTHCDRLLTDSGGPGTGVNRVAAVEASAAYSGSSVPMDSTGEASQNESPRRKLQVSDTSQLWGDADEYSADDFSDVLLDTVYRPLSEAAAPAAIQLRGLESHLPTAGLPTVRRRAQFGFGEEVVQLTAFQKIPSLQRQLMGPPLPNMDQWTQIGLTLKNIYGHRCNATQGCDLLRGTCLNISGLPIYAYDQNGTCTCHPWYTGDTCSELLVNEEVCTMIPDLEQCRSIRTRLYFCGQVEIQDALPEVCLEQGLTVVACGEAGHMRGQRNVTGIPNLVGPPETGYAAMACSKCMARGEVRSESYGKLCDAAVTLQTCQRQENAWSQRLCNYCGIDTQGSVRPQRGQDRSCSYYRGTCMGSVEKRIRGIVPPNKDIVGQTIVGGLRYCKQPSTFTSSRHYFTDEDILQAGQTCLEGTTPTYEAWDYTRQHDNPDTILDRHGLQCLDPNDESTCAKARHCLQGELCHTDTPDWLKMEELVKHWELETLKRYSDQLQREEHCNVFIVTDEFTGEETRYWSLSKEEEAALQIQEIPCTFERHTIVLDAQTAYLEANWPFLSKEYLQSYAKVDWSLDSRLGLSELSYDGQGRLLG